MTPPNTQAEPLIAEIIGPDGTVHYRRPADHDMVEQARTTAGYSVRMVTGQTAKIDIFKEPLTNQELRELDEQYFQASTPEYKSICRMRATITALQARADKAEESLSRLMAGWLPIETAPKDGSHMLLAVGDFGMGTCIGKWFQSTDKGWWTVHSMPVTPTAWQPLPAPPEGHKPATQIPVTPSITDTGDTLGTRSEV